MQERAVYKCVSASYSFAQAKFAKLQMFKVRWQRFLKLLKWKPGTMQAEDLLLDSISLLKLEHRLLF